MDLDFKYSYSDIGQIVFVLIILTVGIVLVIHHRKKFNTYKEAIFLIFSGLFFLLFSTVVNSIMAMRWDINYIVDFLVLIRLDDGIFFRSLAFIGYAFIYIGVAILIIVKFNKIKTKKSNYA